MQHESTTVTAPGWKRVYQPVLCAHFEGRTGVAYRDEERPGETLVTFYRDGKSGSITQPIGEPLEEQFAQLCKSWLLEATNG